VHDNILERKQTDRLQQEVIDDLWNSATSNNVEWLSNHCICTLYTWSSLFYIHWDDSFTDCRYQRSSSL